MSAAERIIPVDRAALDADGQAVYDGIAGSHGDIQGPYRILMQVPALAKAVADVSRALRFTGGLADDDLEICVLATAHYNDTAFVWNAHQKHALKAGISPEIIAALKAGDDTPLSPRQRLIVEVARELTQRRRLNDDLFARALAEFGRPYLVEMATVSGYYTLNAMVIGAFGM